MDVPPNWPIPEDTRFVDLTWPMTSNLAAGAVVFMPTLPSAIIDNLFVPAVENLNIFAPPLYIPVSVSDEKLKEGAPTVPSAALIILPELITSVPATCNAPETRFKESPDAKSNLLAAPLDMTTSPPKVIELAKLAFLDESIAVVPAICKAPETKLKLSPEAKAKVFAAERYNSTSVPKPIPPAAVV